jgi:DNA-directed RNA polymerase specialized sigma24 family protein
MRSMDGMAYEEIASALGITLSSVKVKIHRARLTLAGIRSKQ